MTSRAYKLGLIGYPLGHSLSPRLHIAALEACGLDGSYDLYPVAPLPEGLGALSALIDELRSGQLHGLNVTIPHKQSILPLMDALMPVAAAIGAVNTIYLDGGNVTGDNTDAPAFLSDLHQNGLYPSKKEPTALLLGAGGAARAAVYALSQAGWRIYIVARRIAQAAELAAAFDGQITPLELTAAAIEPLLEQIDLVVNATPLGMAPKLDASPWPAALPYPGNAAVYDMVYNPPETRLVADARNHGLPAATGGGMLVEQAALAFERWTNQPAPRQIMVSAMAAALAELNAARSAQPQERN